MHGIIEQIPQVVTLASTAHTSTLRTKTGVFSVHQIAPVLFDGFDWYKGEGNFLIAEPEKALADYLYFVALGKRTLHYERLDLSEKRIQRSKLIRYLKLYQYPRLAPMVETLYANNRKSSRMVQKVSDD